MRALWALLIAVVISLGMATPAQAHTGCVRFQPKPAQLLIKVKKTDKVPTQKTTNVAAVFDLACGKVYDPDPNSHKPGTRHHAAVEVDFWLERRPKVPQIMIKGQGRDAKKVVVDRSWKKHGRVRETEDSGSVSFGFHEPLMIGTWEYRTVAKARFYGSLGIDEKRWETDAKEIKR